MSSTPHQHPAKPRLLILFHESVPLGASIAMLRVAPQLRALGWHVGGVVPGPGALGALAEESLDYAEVLASPIAFSMSQLRSAPGIKRRCLTLPTYASRLRRVVQDFEPHILHANTLLSMPQVALLTSSRIPTILHAHEVPPPSRKWRLTQHGATRLCSWLIAPSQAVARSYRSFGERRSVVYPGAPPLTARSPSPAPQRPVVVGVLGTTSEIKGTDLLAPIARACRNLPVRFEHAGGSPPNGPSPEIQASITQAQDAGVVFLGHLPTADALSRWDILLHPSRTDAFPLAVLEAMAFGLPTVASAVDGIPEQISHGQTGLLCEAGNVAEFSKALTTFVADASLRARFGRTAQHAVRARFTLERQALGLHAIYSRIALQSGPASGQGRRLVRRRKGHDRLESDA